MKLKHIIEAKEAIVRLTEKRFTDYKKLREIVKLRKAAEAEFEFYCDQEKRRLRPTVRKPIRVLPPSSRTVA